MEIRYKLRKYFYLLFIPVISWLFINYTLNSHIHIKNGYVITHSHPFENSKKSQSPFQSHKHTDFEFAILDLISNIQVVIAFGILILSSLFLIRIVYTLNNYNLPFLLLLFLQNYRAPPK